MVGIYNPDIISKSMERISKKFVETSQENYAKTMNWQYHIMHSIGCTPTD
ncbi:Uncharacterised protein [uncultured archaeon]|nr:Uncharacterised protein [uncultured archaeon]